MARAIPRGLVASEQQVIMGLALYLPPSLPITPREFSKPLAFDRVFGVFCLTGENNEYLKQTKRILTFHT